MQQALAGIGLGGRAKHTFAPVRLQEPHLRVDVAQLRLRHPRAGEQVSDQP
jgi:hypothetical protein